MSGYIVSAADRIAFKRCRRQWDFTATMRRRLVPDSHTTSLERALHDALAVYYFPGMWDWDSAIVLPLVRKAFDDSLARQAGTTAPDAATVEQGRTLLERYFVWAPGVDRFSPVRVATDFEAIVPDPDVPDHGLPGPDGEGVRYTGRVQLLAIDAYDRYWTVEHRLTPGPYTTVEQLVLDEESVAACWAWTNFYDGMAVAGTIFDELTLTTPAAPGTPAPSRRGGIPQHEPSGGGRGVGSPRRMYVKGRPDEDTRRVRRIDGDGFRRTAVRRSPAEVSAAGRQLAIEIREMTRDGVDIYPNPTVAGCSTCAFMEPCLACHDGDDAASLLANRYRRRPLVDVEPGRLGGTPFGVGRGWVPG